MIKEWPVEPIECYRCYDLGTVIDPFKQNERVRCGCQTEPIANDKPLGACWDDIGDNEK